MEKIFTLGTSSRSKEEFLRLLGIHGIEAVADVRRFPTSRFDHFKKELIRELLEKEGISYFYLGEELGGFRKGGYEAYTRTEDFQSGLRRLVEIASLKRTAIVCAERFPWRCHRRFIARELALRGWEVIHILDEERIWKKGG
ncbi:MAG: DUF488 domain-containing protein [Caldiserica bacterium]|nr:DUF488 domain-containing protein [Caldisericota bacterium]MDH7562381.1 DUF488 domain-containing protein [Caldisericota bacterium]